MWGLDLFCSAGRWREDGDVLFCGIEGFGDCSGVDGDRGSIWEKFELVEVCEGYYFGC